jgi:hypothetical protein
MIFRVHAFANDSGFHKAGRRTRPTRLAHPDLRTAAPKRVGPESVEHRIRTEPDQLRRVSLASDLEPVERRIPIAQASEYRARSYGST